MKPESGTKRLSFLGAALAIVLATWAQATLAGEIVQVENASRATSCAEEDNVYVKFVGSGIRHLVIDATLPAYFAKLDRDNRAPDFSRCDMTHDPSYAFEPKQLVLYEDRNYRLVGHTFAHFWRRQSVDFRVGKAVVRDLHLVQLIRKIAGRSIEVLVLYPSDGYWRVKPLPPPQTAETTYGSSFLVGPIEENGRPFVALAAVEFVPAELTFRLTFTRGEGRLHIVEATPDHTRLAVTLPATTGVTAFAALRSMFVSPHVADTAEIRLQPAVGRAETAPVMDFTSAAARAATFARSLPSQHNSSAPDLRFSDFRR